MSIDEEIERRYAPQETALWFVFSGFTLLLFGIPFLVAIYAWYCRIVWKLIMG